MREELYYNVNGTVLTCIEDIHLYIKSRLTKAEYLYDEKLEDIDKMLYPDALRYKIRCSEILIKRLFDVPYQYRDSSRIQHSLESQKFNRMLIDERK